jgi:1-phosphofructokinase
MIYTLTLNPAWDLTYLTGALTFGLNRAKNCVGKAGGKGVNVSRAIRQSGGDCGTLAVLAGETGQTIAGALAAEGMSPVIFSTDGETRTNISAIGEDGTSLEINGPGASVTGNCRRAMESWLTAHLKAGDLLCLCGSLPPMSDTRAGNYYTRLCTLAGKNGAVVVLDCYGAALTDALRGEYPPVLIKPNAGEMAELYRAATGAAVLDWKKEDGTPDTDILRQMAASAADLTKTAVLCTLGSQGAVWISDTETVYVPAVKVETPKAEKGAGDTYLGTFLRWVYGSGADIRTAMTHAAEAAARLVAGEDEVRDKM